MPIASSIPSDKLAALKAIAKPLAGEIIVAKWPAPDGVVVYVPWEYDDDPVGVAKSYHGLRNQLQAQFSTIYPIQIRIPGERQDFYQSIMETADIGDDQVSMELLNFDGELTRLCSKYGYDVQLEILYWLPEIGWLSSEWFGQLRAPGAGTPVSEPRVSLTASIGFRNAQSIIPRRMKGAALCPYVYSRLLSNIEDIVDSGCLAYHGGGAVNNPATGLPYTDCELTKPACIARQGDDLNWGGSETVIDSYFVGQSKGSPVLASVVGNDSRLREPFGVLLGGPWRIKNIVPLAYRPETNTKHPDQAALSSLNPVSEGPFTPGVITEVKVNNQYVKPSNLQIRYGEARQGTTGFSANVNKYSHIALFYADIFGDWRNLQSGGVTAECLVTQGFNKTRVYSDETTFTRQHTTNPAWNIREMYTNKRWGDGQNHNRYINADWLYCANWADQNISWTDPSGNVNTGKRAEFTWFLQSRATQQQIYDACLWAGFGLPFQHEGKIRIQPLEKEPDLTVVPVFSDLDTGEQPTILANPDGTSSIQYWWKDPLTELPYELQVNFYDSDNEFVSRPLSFAARAEQLRESAIFGQYRFQQNPESSTALGVTKLAQVTRQAWKILDLGKFEEGGLKNNLTVRFKTWWKWWKVFNLHRYKVIKIESTKFDKLDASRRFSYFRVMNRRRLSDLTVEITCQAYNPTYYDAAEANPTLTPPSAGEPNPGGFNGWRPGDVNINNLTTDLNGIRFELSVA